MHRARDLLVKQRTQLVNMIRGLLAEFGINIPKGLERALLMARRIVDDEAPDVPIEAAKIHCHSRHSISMFGFAKSIAICSFGNVATMSRVVS